MKILWCWLPLACACANAQLARPALTWSGRSVEVVAPVIYRAHDVRVLGLAIGDVEVWAFPGLDIESGRLSGSAGIFKRIGGSERTALYAGFRLRFEPARRPSALFTLAGTWAW